MGITGAGIGAWAAIAWQAAGNTLFGYGVWATLLARYPAATIAPLRAAGAGVRQRCVGNSAPRTAADVEAGRFGDRNRVVGDRVHRHEEAGGEAVARTTGVRERAGGRRFRDEWPWKIGSSRSLRAKPARWRVQVARRAGHDRICSAMRWRGSARRLRSPLSIGGTILRWDIPAGELGSASATWAD